MMSRRSSQSQAAVVPALPKREAILRAALKVFAEHGVHGVAVPEIANEAKVGTGTIYRCFASKEELVNELYREKKRELRQRIGQGLDAKLGARELFAEVWRRLVTFVREDPEGFRFLELQDHLPYLDAESRALEKRVLEPMVRTCKELQKRGELRDDLRAEVILALHWGAFVNLFKAERHGYLTLRARDIDAAREAAFRLCAPD